MNVPTLDGLTVLFFALNKLKVEQKTHKYCVKKSFSSRRVTFSVALEGKPFIKGIEGLDKAICAFLYVCFIGNLQYPEVII